MAFWATAGVRTPWLRMTEGAEAVAYWVPPGEPELTDEEEPAFARLLIELLGARAREVETLFARFGEHHPHDRPHYYLSLWGTHADHAGRGLGTALIREDLARIDAERMPAYLESTNPVNVARYEALGFRRQGDFSHAASPLITTMWREPR
jgi:ribosomal protein S18 acetylase RimI-like enzyme